jgi:hypothetical protein
MVTKVSWDNLLKMLPGRSGPETERRATSLGFKVHPFRGERFMSARKTKFLRDESSDDPDLTDDIRPVEPAVAPKPGQRKASTAWTAAEEAAVREAVMRGATSYEDIAMILPTERTASAIAKRMTKLGVQLRNANVARPGGGARNAGTRGGPWTDEETETLRVALDGGAASVEALVEMIPGRTKGGIAHRMKALGLAFPGGESGGDEDEGMPRWRAGGSRAGPNSKTACWTPEEEATLRGAIDAGAQSCAEIADMLPGRTPGAVETRMRKLGLRFEGGASASGDDFDLDDEEPPRRTRRR